MTYRALSILLMILASATSLVGCRFNREGPLRDKAITPVQAELLEMAIDTATAIPVEPHIKDRSLAQEKVVTACLRLDQPARATRYAGRIEDWRRGSSLADIGLYCAQHGLKDRADDFIAQATKVLEATEDWRKDVIKVKIAQTHMVMGRPKEAAEFEANVVEAEQGKVAQIEAAQSDDTDFGSQVENLNKLIATQTFDLVKNALDAYVRLYDRYYPDADRRSLIEARIRSSWEPQPVLHRIEWLNGLVRAALDHQDQAKALELVNEVQGMVEGNEWPAEARLAILAPIISLRHQAGDSDKAKTDADAALEFFEQNKKLIFDIWRAGALRPLAEAEMNMGHHETAQAIYGKALEEGALNPNSRPRAEDLSATCSSMAAVGFEPDEQIWEEIRKIRNKLGEPW